MGLRISGPGARWPHRLVPLDERNREALGLSWWRRVMAAKAGLKMSSSARETVLLHVAGNGQELGKIESAENQRLRTLGWSGRSTDSLSKDH